MLSEVEQKRNPDSIGAKSRPVASGKGKIFVISGPSGVGKGTVINLAKPGLKNFGQIATLTTRGRRKGGRRERDRIFVSEAKFKDMIKKDQVAEYDFHHGEYYGTPKKDLEKLLNKGKNVLLEIDVNGARRIKKKYPQNAILVFIWAPIENIEKRLRKRKQNTEAEIQERLKRIEKEFRTKKFYNFAIENRQGKPKEAAKKLVEICQDKEQDMLLDL